MRKILALAALAIVGVAVSLAPSADAYTCNTTCYGSGSYRSCTTNCF